VGVQQDEAGAALAAGSRLVLKDRDSLAGREDFTEPVNDRHVSLVEVCPTVQETCKSVS
jgi:hypothetical protein